MFIINIELKRGRARKRERNANARIVRGPDEVDVSRRDGAGVRGTVAQVRGERSRDRRRGCPSGRRPPHGARCWWSRAGSRLRSGRTPKTDRSGTASIRFVSFRREVVRIASLDAAGRRAEVEKQRGIAEERLRRRCAEEGADYGVCGAADSDGAAPTPDLAARYNRGWSRIRGRVGTLLAAEAALVEAVDAAPEAAEPAARLAALEAREAGPGGRVGGSSG